jgi:hypothetical protein
MMTIIPTVMANGDELFSEEELVLIKSNADYRLKLLEKLRGSFIGNIRMAAVIMREAQESGQEIPEQLFSKSAQAALLRVAYGQALPEVINCFANNVGRMRKIACLPLPDQRRLISGAVIEVAVESREGSGYTTNLVKQGNMTKKQWDQVIGENGIRSFEAHCAWLEIERVFKVKKKPVCKDPKPTFDRTRKKMVIPPLNEALEVDAATLMEWLKKLV